MNDSCDSSPFSLLAFRACDEKARVFVHHSAQCCVILRCIAPLCVCCCVVVCVGLGGCVLRLVLVVVLGLVLVLVFVLCWSCVVVSHCSTEGQAMI